MFFLLHVSTTNFICASPLFLLFFASLSCQSAFLPSYISFVSLFSELHPMVVLPCLRNFCTSLHLFLVPGACPGFYSPTYIFVKDFISWSSGSAQTVKPEYGLLVQCASWYSYLESRIYLVQCTSWYWYLESRFLPSVRHLVICFLHIAQYRARLLLCVIYFVG